MKSILDERSADSEEPDGLIRLPQDKPKVLFRIFSRIAALLALILIFLGFLFDAADIDGGIEPTTLLLLGLYVLGVQIYFLVEYFVDTGGVDYPTRRPLRSIGLNQLSHRSSAQANPIKIAADHLAVIQDCPRLHDNRLTEF